MIIISMIITSMHIYVIRGSCNGYNSCCVATLLSPLYLFIYSAEIIKAYALLFLLLQQGSLHTPLLCVVGKYVVHCIFLSDMQKLCPELLPI